MVLDNTRTERIFDALAQKGECELDELVLACPQFGWPQIFLEIDRLSREGQVRLVARGCGIYVVSLAGNDSGRTSCTDRASFLGTGNERSYASDRLDTIRPPVK